MQLVQTSDTTEPLTVSVALPTLLVVIFDVVSGHVVRLVIPATISKIVLVPVFCVRWISVPAGWGLKRFVVWGFLQSPFPAAELKNASVKTAATGTSPSIFRCFIIFSLARAWIGAALWAGLPL